MTANLNMPVTSISYSSATRAGATSLLSQQALRAQQQSNALTAHTLLNALIGNALVNDANPHDAGLPELNAKNVGKYVAVCCDLPLDSMGITSDTTLAEFSKQVQLLPPESAGLLILHLYAASYPNAFRADGSLNKDGATDFVKAHIKDSAGRARAFTALHQSPDVSSWRLVAHRVTVDDGQTPPFNVLPLDCQWRPEPGKSSIARKISSVILGLNALELRLTRGAHSSIFGTNNLSGAKLPGIRFSANAVMTGKTLVGADLSKARLSWANWEGADLRYANFRDGVAWDANFSGANLTGADLRGCDFGSANLSGANLSLTKLDGAYLGGANLRNANLSRATGVPLCSPPRKLNEPFAFLELDSVNLEDATFAPLALDMCEVSVRDRTLNHINNGDRSLLRTIDGIAPKYASTKIQAMSQVVALLEKAIADGADVSDIYEPLADFLGTSLYVSGNPSIRRFVDKRLVPWQLAHYQNAALPAKQATYGTLNHIHAKLRQADATGALAWARACSFAILQILAVAENNAARLPEEEALAVRETLVAIRQDYHRLLPEPVKAIVQDFCESEGSPVTAYFPLLSPTSEVCLLMDNAHLDACMREEVTDADRQLQQEIAVIESWNATRSTVIDANRHLTTFEVLRALRLAQKGPLALKQAINTLLPETHRVNFWSATRGTPDKKWVNKDDQRALRRFILPLLGCAHDDDVAKLSDVTLPTAIRDRLFEDSQLFQAGEPSDGSEKAYYLRSLATAFAYGSSARSLGDEGNSPEALRVLAVALLNSADELDPDRAGFIRQDLEDYRAKLLGIGDGFTCSAILADRLHRQLAGQQRSDARLQTILAETMPVRWR